MSDKISNFLEYFKSQRISILETFWEARTQNLGSQLPAGGEGGGGRLAANTYLDEESAISPVLYSGSSVRGI